MIEKIPGLFKITEIGIVAMIIETLAGVASPELSFNRIDIDREALQAKTTQVISAMRNGTAEDRQVVLDIERLESSDAATRMSAEESLKARVDTALKRLDGGAQEERQTASEIRKLQEKFANDSKKFSAHMGMFYYLLLATGVFTVGTGLTGMALSRREAGKSGTMQTR